jgi:hypothetical protein
MSNANESTLSKATLAKLAELNAAVLDVTGDVTEAEWQLNSVSENWPLGLLASHIANGYTNVAGWIRKVLDGQPLTVTGDEIDEANHEAAEAYTPQSGDELLALLKTKMADLNKLVEGLSDAQMAQAAPMTLIGGREVTPAFLVERVLRHHTRGHLESFRLTLASVRDEITA